MRIMIVEDSEDMRLVLAQFLEREGFTVAAICEDGEQAYSRLAAGEVVDCICSDYQMPTMNGLQLLSGVRNILGLSVPFLVFSSEWDLSPFTRAGATACFNKPDSRQLVEYLHKLRNAL
jgi:CheY-like chemotaxis protein